MRPKDSFLFLSELQVTTAFGSSCCGSQQYLSMCLYTYISMHICIYVYIYTHICIRLSMYVYMSLSLEQCSQGILAARLSSETCPGPPWAWCSNLAGLHRSRIRSSAGSRRKRDIMLLLRAQPRSCGLRPPRDKSKYCRNHPRGCTFARLSLRLPPSTLGSSRCP